MGRRAAIELVIVLMIACSVVGCTGTDVAEIEGYWECSYQVDETTKERSVLVLRSDPWNGLTGLTMVTWEGSVRDSGAIFDQIWYRDRHIEAVSWARDVRFDGLYDATSSTIHGRLERHSRPPQELVLQRFYPRASLVPEDFDIPSGLKGVSLQLRRPIPADAEQTYRAAVEARARISAMLGFTWPPEGHTLANERVRLQRLSEKLKQRQGFSYVVTADGSDQVIGEVAVRPAHPLSAYDAVIWLWLNDSALEAGLGEPLRTAVEQWIDQDWPFNRFLVRGP